LNRMKLEDDRSACYRADELQARELKLMKLEDDRSACRRADKRQEEARAAVFNPFVANFWLVFFCLGLHTKS
jgi:hypothetical protein